VAIGTTGVVYANHREELSRTTPEIDDLYRLFVNLRDEGIRDVVMEVSSHALVLERVTGLQFQSVGFTNLTTDHLDFHGTFENYHEAKSKAISREFQ
jgi:UDP-N-acetylmuramoyl-L-alanyl-D-glutamate--2,6-diaminopimelate ligase